MIYLFIKLKTTTPGNKQQRYLNIDMITAKEKSGATRSDEIRTDEIRTDEVDYRAVIEGLEHGVIIHDHTGRIIAVNQAACNMLNADQENIVGVNALEHISATYHLDGTAWEKEDSPILKTLSTGEAMNRITIGIDVPSADGKFKRLWTIANTKPIRLSAQEVGVIATFMDITDLQEHNNQLQAAFDRFSALMARSGDMITLSDNEGRIKYASPAFFEITGVAEKDAIGTYLRDYIHPEDLEANAEKVQYLQENLGSVVEISIRLRAWDNSWRHLEIVASNHLEDPAVQGIVGNARDVTTRIQENASLAYQATHDALTGLANRALLLDHLEIAIARAKRSGVPIALYYLDIDGFKKVNDTYGHTAGDKLIIAVAERLKEVTRPGDTIARFGGDEFVMLAEGILDITTSLSIAERVRRAIYKPVPLTETSVSVSASIGISLSRNNDGPTMIDEADSALYKAKEHGGNRFEIYDDVMKQDMFGRSAKMKLVNEIIEKKELRITFLPVVSLQNHRIMAASASFITYIPEDTTLSFSDILPFSCEINLGRELYATILDNICKSVSDSLTPTMDKKILIPKCAIRIPIANRMLVDETIVSTIASPVNSYGLKKELFCFEINEQALLDAGPAAASSIVELTKMGFLVLLTNVGAGWSSFNLLSRLPISRLKLDPTLTEQIHEQPGSSAIAAAVASLGAGLGISTIASGVRLRTQANLLSSIGYNEAEGPLFGHALTIQELTETV